MSKHIHLEPLPEMRRPARGNLPSQRYGALVGRIDHITARPRTEPETDSGHIFLWVEIYAGPYTGHYECPILTDPHSEDETSVRYFLHTETIPHAQLPSIGFWEDAQLSYDALRLDRKHFRPVLDGSFRSTFMFFAHTCDQLAVYGTTYKEGNGLHHIRRNPDGKGKQDGAVAFYFRKPGEKPIRRWVFLEAKPA